MQHLRWEKSGRTFTGDKPGQFVYKSSIGQQNVDLGNGQFAPYVWDKTKRIVRFADCELRFTASGLEFWHREERLNTFSFNPEAKQGLNFERKIPTVGNLAIEEIDPGNSKAELKISYKITTVDAETEVSVKAGYNHKVHFGTRFKALKDGIEQRVALEFAEKLEPVEERDRQGEILPIARLKTDKSWWAWSRRTEQADHELEQIEVTKIHLGRKVYALNEEKIISPDTWGTDVGIAANADDGLEGDSTWFVDGDPTYNDNYIGYVNSLLYYMATRWDGITIAKNSTIDSCLVDLFCTGYEDPTERESRMYAWANDDAPICDGDNLPSGITKTTAYATTTSVFTDSVEWKTVSNTTVLQEIINRAGWVSGNAVNFLFIPIYGGGDWYRCFEDYYVVGTNEAELTITYTPAGGLSIPVAMDIYRQRRN